MVKGCNCYTCRREVNKNKMINWKSSKIWTWVIAIIVVLVIVGLFTGVIHASQTNHEDKVNICHLTNSESNPWVAQQVNANELQSHLDNGDFLYKGKTKDDGKPDNKDKQADQWCENHQPEVTPTPTPTPTPTVTPTATPSATVEVDKCPNNDLKFAGIQTEVPQGATVDPRTGNCVDIVSVTPTPAAATVAAVTELPATGDNSLLTYLALALGLIGIGTAGSIYAGRKLD